VFEGRRQPAVGRAALVVARTGCLRKRMRNRWGTRAKGQALRAMRASEGGAQKRSQSMSRSSDASSSVGTEYAEGSIFVSIPIGPATVVPMDAHQRSLVTMTLTCS